jgi:hypothetical protein
MAEEDPRITIAIVGSAGRNEDALKISAMLFDSMILKAESIVTKQWDLSWDKVKLVSGGAAFADHVAVALFLKYPETQLLLALPAPWKDGRYSDRTAPLQDYSTGERSNGLHRRFSRFIGRNSLSDLQEAMDRGAEVLTYNDFFARNRQVAKAERMIAFTFGEGPTPKEGGTKYTWDRCTSKDKIHVTLNPM